ncbi:MAG: transport-associated protein [Polaromonas sp.]|nr:transport-associated protein [Polaromonas sp.]
MNDIHNPVETASLFRHGSSRLAASLLMILGLGACHKADDRPTAGQQLDAAIHKTERLAEEAKAKAEDSGAGLKAKTEETFANAGIALKNATESAESSAKVATDKAIDKMDDMAITTAISAALAKDPEIKLLKINVDTKSGAVVLNGSVPDASVRDRAGAMAKTFNGVQSVDNRLVIKAQ